MVKKALRRALQYINSNQTKVLAHERWLRFGDEVTEAATKSSIVGNDMVKTPHGQRNSHDN